MAEDIEEKVEKFIDKAVKNLEDLTLMPVVEDAPEVYHIRRKQQLEMLSIWRYIQRRVRGV